MSRIERVDEVEARWKMYLSFADSSNERYAEQLKEHQKEMEEYEWRRKHTALYDSTIQ